MDGRTAYVAGGFIVGAAVVAVACAVTLSNASALTDSPGEAAEVGVVRVTPSPAPTRLVPTPIPVAPAPVPTTEVVPAPEPEDVAPAPSREAGAPVAEAPVDTSGPSEQQVVEEALRTGSWEALRQWAVEKGWSAEKISRFIESLQHRLNADAPTTGDRKPVELVPPAELVLPDDSQRRFMPPPEVPSVPDQSSTPDVPSGSEREATTSEQTKGPEKQHPAHPQTPADPAGGPSDHGASKPGGWMRDQSPQPPRGD